MAKRFKRLGMTKSFLTERVGMTKPFLNSLKISLQCELTFLERACRIDREVKVATQNLP